MRCRPPCPKEIRRRATAASRTRRWPARAAAVRGLRARAVLHGPLRLLRLQHLHGRRARHRDRRARAPRGRRTPAPRSRRSGWPGGCSARPAPGRDGLLRRRHPDAAQPGRPRRGPGRDRRRARAGAGRRGHHRGQPGQRHQGRPGRAARGGLHPDLVRHAVRGRPRADRAGPHPRPGPGPGRGGVGAGGRASSRSAWTSSTARRGSRWPTGRPRSTPRWRARPTTSRRTP